MSRYYKATEVDEFLNIFGKGNCNLCAFYDECNPRGLDGEGSHRYCWQAKRFPTADVTEVKHGKWIYADGDVGYNVCRCSKCDGVVVLDEEVTYNYCPNCGAKMDGERKDEK